MQTLVKKWFKEKDYGFLENGAGPEIKVHKPDLVQCQYLKAGATVEFECHPNPDGLIAKKVRLVQQKKNTQSVDGKGNKRGGPNFIGVMT